MLWYALHPDLVNLRNAISARHVPPRPIFSIQPVSLAPLGPLISEDALLSLFSREE